jgi:DUF1365 family protein
MVGQVMHHRLRPLAHGFRYRLAMYRLDLAELDTINARLRLFGVDRTKPVSFWRADHATDVRAQLAAGGIADIIERVEVVANCRIFGYVFNPVSFFFCYATGDQMVAIVVEVNNTFGETHTYVLRCDAQPVDRQAKKVFHVSPFFTLDGTYRFRFDVTPHHLDACIDLYRGGQPLFVSRLSLDRRPLTDRSVAAALLRYPLVTAKIIAAIHWEALRLWWKGVPVQHKPAYDPETARRTTES